MARTVWRIRQILARIGQGLTVGMIGFFTGCLSEVPDSVSGISGWSDYEVRLQATADEFAYNSLLDQNLSPDVWEVEGIALRVPKPFQALPSTVRNPNEEHALSRDVLGEPLPGVLGVWQAHLPGKNGKSPETAYLFAMSNHHLWSHSRTSALAFHQSLVEDVLAELSDLSHLPIASDWTTENESGHGQPYAFATFRATLPQTRAKADFTLFLFQHGMDERRNEIKAALLFVIPVDATFSGSAADVDPKALSAQTLHITPRAMGGP
jgi:hypothetical protein